MLHYTIHKTATRHTRQNSINKQIYFAFAVGMVVNLVSIYIGNPYIVSLMVLPVAAIATIKWVYQPMPWIVLVSVVAANPVNLNASVAFNLIFALFFLILNMRNLNKLPSWIYPLFIFAVISILGSVVNWSETGQFSTQLAAIGNYVVGPFILIPLVYFRLQKETDANLLLRVFVVSLIVPSVVTMLLVRIFGTPMIDASLSHFKSLVNVSVYRLGNTNFHLTRTQSGILLAVLICTSLAVFINGVSKRIRLLVLASLVVITFLLLTTGSVGSSLAALCGIALILVMARRYIKIKKFMAIIAILIVLVPAGWSQVPQGIKKYVGSRYEEKLSAGINVSDRSGRWQDSLDYLVEHPLGRGWDLWVAPIGTYPHNDYLSYGIAFGFVCGLLYLLVPVKILSTIVSVKSHIIEPAKVALILAGTGAATVLVINSFADHLTANRWYFNVVWSIIWYCYFASRPSTG